MKELKLTNSNKAALVDDEDYERLSKYSWILREGGNGIVIRRSVSFFKREWITLSCDVMKDYKQLYDHKDTNAFNNQKENLRTCSNHENSFNKNKQKGIYTSKYKGVSWSNSTNNWRAYIIYKNRYRHLGTFDKEEDAALAYNNEALKRFGEFANINKLCI